MEQLKKLIDEATRHVGRAMETLKEASQRAEMLEREKKRAKSNADRPPSTHLIGSICHRARTARLRRRRKSRRTPSAAICR